MMNYRMGWGSRGQSDRGSGSLLDAAFGRFEPGRRNSQPVHRMYTPHDAISQALAFIAMRYDISHPELQAFIAIYRDIWVCERKFLLRALRARSGRGVLQ